MQVGKYFLAKDIHNEIFLDLLYLKIYGIFKREDFGFPAWWNCYCWISRRVPGDSFLERFSLHIGAYVH
jgi:hypothetical protein